MFAFRDSIDVPNSVCLGGRSNQIKFTHSEKTMDFVIKSTDIINLSVTEIQMNVPVVMNDNLTVNNISVTGNATIGGNTTIGGNATVEGDLTVNGSLVALHTDNLIIEDPLIKQAIGNTGDSVDIGNYGVYNDGTTKFAGLFRDASDGVFKFFSGVTLEPTTTIDTSITSSGFNSADIMVGAITSGNITANAIIGTDLFINVTSLTANSQTGYVGIGTTTPSQLLEINGGNALISGINWGTTTGDNTYFYLGDTNYGVQSIYNQGIKLFVTGADSGIFLQDSTGYVGIGTTDPSSILTVNGDIGVTGNILPLANDTYDLGSTTSRFKDLFLSGNTIHLGDARIGTSGTTDLQFQTGTTHDTKFYIGSAGNTILFADQNISDTDSAMILRKYAIGTTDNRFINFERASDDISTSGISVGGIRLDGAGSIALDSVSSIILKENIRENKDDCYNVVKKLRGVKFDWKYNDIKDVDGFIAEEVKDNYPYASGRINGINSITMQTLIPILWSALRKSIDKIETLERKYAMISMEDTSEVDKHYCTTSDKQINNSKSITSNKPTMVTNGKIYEKQPDGSWKKIM